MLPLPDHEPDNRPHGKLTPQRWTKRMAESAPLLDQVLIPDLTNVALSYLEPAVLTTEVKVQRSGDGERYTLAQELLPGTIIVSVRNKREVFDCAILYVADPELSATPCFPYAVAEAPICSIWPFSVAEKEIIVTLMELDPPMHPSASYVDPDEYLETYFETQ